MGGEGFAISPHSNSDSLSPNAVPLEHLTERHCARKAEWTEDAVTRGSINCGRDTLAGPSLRWTRRMVGI